MERRAKSPTVDGGALQHLRRGAVWLVVAVSAACGDADRASGPDASGAAGRPASLRGRDCVVVVLDALHATHLGSYGGDPQTSAVADALAARGTRFASAWSPTTWTLPSTASLFTGLAVPSHGVDPVGGATDKRLDESAVTLAERFAQAGYATRGYSQNPFPSAAFGLDQGFESLQLVRSDGPAMVPRIAADLAARDDARPLFLYVHFLRPHTPYDGGAEHRRLFVDASYEGTVTGREAELDGHNSGRERLAPTDIAHLRNLYRATLREVDAELGALLAALDDEALVVLLSDHGEAFAQHGSLGHSWLAFEEYVHVPLIMAGAGLPAGRVVDVPVSTVDVFPTLVELFGLGVGAAAGGGEPSGRSLVPTLGEREPGVSGSGGIAAARPVFTVGRAGPGGERWLAVREGRWKLLRRLPDGLRRLHDLVADPHEQTDRSAAEPEQTRRLTGLLSTWLDGQEPRYGVAPEGDLDAGVEQRLRELGY